MSQIKESASVKDLVITPSPSTGAVPCCGMAQGATEGGGKGRLSPNLFCECCSFLCLALVTFIGTNFQNFYWRMGKSNSILESSSSQCFLISFILWSLLMRYFCPFCLLFLDNQCSKEQMVFGYWKVQDGKRHLGTSASLRVKSIKAE